MHLRAEATPGSSCSVYPSAAQMSNCYRPAVPAGHITIAEVAALKRGIGAERLARYEADAGQNPARAVDLYLWNAALSAATFEDLSLFEVALRNACHAQLQSWNNAQGHAHPWYHHVVLNPRHMQDVGVARNRVLQGSHSETEGRVVAELTMGFWRLLFSKSYESTLWTPCLRHAFPNQEPRTRALVYDRLDGLNTLRNRIAHHEPIYRSTVGRLKRNLEQLHQDAIEVLGWIDGDLASWAARSSRLPDLLSRSPLSTVG